LMAWPDWPWPPYFTTDLRHWPWWFWLGCDLEERPG